MLRTRAMTIEAGVCTSSASLGTYAAAILILMLVPLFLVAHTRTHTHTHIYEHTNIPRPFRCAILRSFKFHDQLITSSGGVPAPPPGVGNAISGLLLPISYTQLWPPVCPRPGSFTPTAKTTSLDMQHTHAFRWREATDGTRPT